MGKGKGKFYAVRVGAVPGIYHSWDECKGQVLRYPGSVYKSFSNRIAAELFMDGGGVQNASVRPRTSASSLSRPLINNAPPAIPRHTQRTHGLLHQQQPHQQQQQRHYQDNAPNLHGNYPRTPTPNHQAPLSHSSVPVSPTTHTNSPPASALEQALAAGRGVPVMCGHCTQLTYCLAFDGASRGNPGFAGCGAVFIEHDSEKEVLRMRQPLPYGTTNDEAEYAGLIMGLQAALTSGMQHLVVKGDAQLIIRQLEGVNRVNSAGLLPYFKTAMSLSQEILSTGQSSISLHHVLREHNMVADRLSNEAIDMQVSDSHHGLLDPDFH
mmetsp:Transcript_10871/g.28309  ORF Transcript_10871/g.28309 Transcript_10871/m.28309 type:complete len:324 (-) Transcript_10871:321-1292(-)